MKNRVREFALLLSAGTLAVVLCSRASLFADAPDAGKGAPPVVTRQGITDQEIQLLRQNVREQRRQIVAGNLPLTTEESAKFWPVYDTYIAEVTQITDTRIAQIKDYAANYNTLTETQAMEYIRGVLAFDRAVHEVQVKYLPIFAKAVPPKKAAMFMQMDRRLQKMVDLQRSGIVPLINPQ
jgi:hypothetical protein